MQLIPYINFNGNTDEAMKYYQSIFGGEISVMKFKDSPPDEIEIPDEAKEKIMHGELKTKNITIYFSDSLEKNKFNSAQQISLVVELDEPDSQKTIYDKLSKDGKILMKLEETFWNAIFATVVDKYGVCWSLNYQKKS
jgi:PhnB protein